MGSEKGYTLRCTLTFGDIYAQILIWILVIVASLAAGLARAQPGWWVRACQIGAPLKPEA